ncbi:unnamed protein product [Leptidea sinapis]|uniref:Uncharacterized protein n=1 Tax=Leptidea sinapis TaxID=189913 RepID=A0A5E4PNA4_9NEOP|nr:unnamed protein product [Leptidea sinapis]
MPHPLAPTLFNSSQTMQLMTNFNKTRKNLIETREHGGAACQVRQWQVEREACGVRQAARPGCDRSTPPRMRSGGRARSVTAQQRPRRRDARSLPQPRPRTPTDWDHSLLTELEQLRRCYKCIH